MQRLARVALRWLPLVLIVVVGLALSIYASFRSAQNSEAQAWAEFERQATGDDGRAEGEDQRLVRRSYRIGGAL